MFTIMTINQKHRNHYRHAALSIASFINHKAVVKINTHLVPFSMVRVYIEFKNYFENYDY